MMFDQWLQDCLAYLLKLMSQFSVMPSDFDAGAHDDIFDLLDSPVKKMRKNKPPVEKFVVARLNKVLHHLYNSLSLHSFMSGTNLSDQTSNAYWLLFS